MCVHIPASDWVKESLKKSTVVLFEKLINEFSSNWNFHHFDIQKNNELIILCLFKFVSYNLYIHPYIQSQYPFLNKANSLFSALLYLSVILSDIKKQFKMLRIQ